MEVGDDPVGSGGGPRYLPYSGLFSWGANFHYFRDSPTSHTQNFPPTKFSTYNRTVQRVGAVVQVHCTALLEWYKIDGNFHQLSSKK